MVARGGGLEDIYLRTVPSTKQKSKTHHVIHILMNVCDAMGANIATAVAEGLAPRIGTLFQCRVGPRILSNLTTKRLVKVHYISSYFPIRPGEP
jgi:hydroxymethylglutaryl-CoA reductase